MIQHQQKGKTSSVHDNVVEASQESRSCYVIDTNVLLYDWRALFAFPHATIMVPITVLEELDSFKVETSERGRNARRAIRIFDEAREMGSLVNGVNLKGPEGTPVKIQVIFNEQVDKFSTENSNDNKIIAAVGSIHESGKPVTFISKDLNARVKTNVLGFKVQDYVSQNVNVDRVYKGWADFELPPAEVKTATPEMVAEMMQKKHPWQNQFVHLKADYDRPYSRLFRRIGEKFVEVTYEESLWSFYPKNVQQLMALDLLMDDKIKLVSLLGPAGTGKTFVTLLAALHKVMKESVYRKLLVARPVVALGSDIGYLPGDMKEKLFHWMKPIYDNLEQIFSQSKISTYHQDYEAEGGLLEHRKGGKHFRHRSSNRRSPHNRHDHDNDHQSSRSYGSSTFHNDIERLQRKGVISFEAITYMRGRSIPQQFIFIDEVQNLTPHEVKTIVSRAGDGTKVVLAGDPNQIDSPYLDYSCNGLTVTTEKFKGEEIFGVVQLESCERSALADRAAKLL